MDEDDAVHLGGYPGVLRDLLGLSIGEFLPLHRDREVALDGGGTGRIWAEEIALHGAEAKHRFVEGPAAGGPAVTRHRVEEGTAWYVATTPDPATLREILRAAAQDAGVAFDTRTPDTLELVERSSADGARYLFAINHADEPVEVAAAGTDLLTGESFAGTAAVAGGAVRVIKLQD